MSIPIRASNWIINALHAKRMSQKDFFEGLISSACMGIVSG